ncbi:malto-oligosyltrehalose synthase [Candidatus Protochlamydia sp. W-9]|uniref:malto-oligosyltrehalose synthase n=1 Tax=Candidatus Protochlamydia sp. W-9 TaxID=1785087 RepID=UPI00096A9EE3|nr:malto-oligosyltrehalose synthase [Candidatus Protochlamydia sp. W-9]
MNDLPIIPLVTYRLQFNQHFTFNQASKLIPYFKDLGISHLYASPINKSQPGSLHGYDLIDITQLNPDIGTEEEFFLFTESLRAMKMGLIVDFVPNHMCINEGNKWWNDVLENGLSSLYAEYFDITWTPPKPELNNKVLLPILDKQYGKVIDDQKLKIVFKQGAFFVQYHKKFYPLNPSSWVPILNLLVEHLKNNLECNQSQLSELESIVTALEYMPSILETDLERRKERSREKEVIKKRLVELIQHNPTILIDIHEVLKKFNVSEDCPPNYDNLEKLLNEQAYRLSYWRVTNEEINYRRFCDINELASMCVENEDVFDKMHSWIFNMIKQNHVQGLRIDHVDGLFDPDQYFMRLQGKYKQLLGNYDLHEQKAFYVVIEKILIGNEKLRSHWLVHGTTGYDFLNLVNGVFVFTQHSEDFYQIYRNFTGSFQEIEEIIYQAKKLILSNFLSSELQMLSRCLELIAEQHRWSRDYTFESLRSALIDIVACFPVYRSYIRFSDEIINPEDKVLINEAIKLAKKVNPASDLSVLNFVRDVLLFENPPGLNQKQIDDRKYFIMRFQQLSAPIAAKGIEDTFFYRFYPLSSLNEVGMKPGQFGIDVSHFHRINQMRLQNWPHSLLTTFTHDTKRSEDVRARINVLSEDPQEWNLMLNRWHKFNHLSQSELHQKEIDRNEEYLLYQTLIGTWPIYEMDANALVHYCHRIELYMIKALREAKIHTSWINHQVDYENSVRNFIQRILSPDSLFLIDFKAWIPKIIKAGLFNSISQLILKITSPGIPDFYQGSELWEFSLVDPDNRHLVDYSSRPQLLQIIKQRSKEDLPKFIHQLVQNPEDGLIKLYVTSVLLNFRNVYFKIFQEGDYQPVEIIGDKSQHVIAFTRSISNMRLLVVVGRFFKNLTDISKILPINQVWEQTYLSISLPNREAYRDILSGQTFEFEPCQSISLSQLFSHFPFAVLLKE